MTAITDDLPARLLNEEHAGWRAIVAGQAADYYLRVMTKDALMIVAGAVIDRDGIRAAFESAPPWDSYQIREPAVIRLGDRAGILVYRAVATRGDETVELRMSTTYLLEDGGWLVAAHQQTPV